MDKATASTCVPRVQLGKDRGELADELAWSLVGLWLAESLGKISDRIACLNR